MQGSLLNKMSLVHFSIYMCVCVCIYIYIYMYIYVCVCVYIYICIYICVYIHIYMCVCVCVCVCVCMCVCVCVLKWTKTTFSFYSKKCSNTVLKSSQDLIPSIPNSSSNACLSSIKRSNRSVLKVVRIRLNYK